MFEALPLTEYLQTLNSKRRNDEQIHKHYTSCVHQLVTKWASRLNSHQITILLFIFDRTFYHGKLSETVVFDQFMHGMQRADRDEMVFCGLKISMPTLLKQLNELAREDFLHVRACMSSDGRGEIRSRLYAINCKKLFNLDIADEKNPMILREPKQKKQVVEWENEDKTTDVEMARSVLKTPRKVRVTPSKNPPQNFEGIYIHNKDTKVSKSFGVAPLADVTQKDKVQAIQDYIARTTEARKARSAVQAERAKQKAAQPGTLNRKDVQALLNDLMSRYYPALPRMVVADKPLSVLKKRLKDAEISDIGDFFEWAVSFWENTERAHTRSYFNRMKEDPSAKVPKPLPKAPDFSELCYRFPYFAACYRSYLVERKSGAATSELEVEKRKVEKLQRALAGAKEEKQALLQQARQVRRRTREVPQHEEERRAAPIRVTRSTRAATGTAYDPLLDDDAQLPTWEEVQANKKRAAK